MLSHHGDAFFVFSNAAGSMIVRICPFTSSLLHRGVVGDDLFCSHKEARQQVSRLASASLSGLNAHWQVFCILGSSALAADVPFEAVLGMRVHCQRH
jgi:hypothetical protein